MIYQVIRIGSIHIDTNTTYIQNIEIRTLKHLNNLRHDSQSQIKKFGHRVTHRHLSFGTNFLFQCFVENNLSYEPMSTIKWKHL